MKFFDTKLVGDLLQRIEDHGRIERFLTVQTLNVVFSVFSFVVFGVVLLVYNLNIFLVFLAGSIVYGLWVLLFLKRRRLLDYQYFEKQAVSRNIVLQLINGMQEIKLQGCEQRKRWQWEDAQADLFDVNMKALSLQQNQEAGGICINELKNILTTVLAAAAVIHGEMTLGMMLAVQYIIGQLNSPVEQLVGFVYQWQDVGIALERMNEIHTRKNEENGNRTVSCVADNDIAIENLCFKYERALPHYVLDGISLKIPQGKVTAIVGASGSGKTTLVKLPLGYNTMIGQDGQGLSQGQRQRILIARAVYKNPQFLFFDEATNALDANNERAIVENLNEFYKGKTVVIVAHRLSTVKNADNIVVLEHGKIVEQGTHAELTTLKGRYFELVRNQLELGN